MRLTVSPNGVMIFAQPITTCHIFVLPTLLFPSSVSQRPPRRLFARISLEPSDSTLLTQRHLSPQPLARTWSTKSASPLTSLTTGLSGCFHGSRKSTLVAPTTLLAPRRYPKKARLTTSALKPFLASSMFPTAPTALHSLPACANTTSALLPITRGSLTSSATNVRTSGSPVLRATIS